MLQHTGFLLYNMLYNRKTLYTCFVIYFIIDWIMCYYIMLCNMFYRYKLIQVPAHWLHNCNTPFHFDWQINTCHGPLLLGCKLQVKHHPYPAMCVVPPLLFSSMIPLIGTVVLFCKGWLFKYTRHKCTPKLTQQTPIFSWLYNTLYIVKKSLYSLYLYIALWKDKYTLSYKLLSNKL